MSQTGQFVLHKQVIFQLNYKWLIGTKTIYAIVMNCGWFLPELWLGDDHTFLFIDKQNNKSSISCFLKLVPPFWCFASKLVLLYLCIDVYKCNYAMYFYSFFDLNFFKVILFWCNLKITQIHIGGVWFVWACLASVFIDHLTRLGRFVKPIYVSIKT